MAKNLSRYQPGRLSTKDLYNSTNTKYAAAPVIGEEQFFATGDTPAPTIVVRRRESPVISS